MKSVKSKMVVLFSALMFIVASSIGFMIVKSSTELVIGALNHQAANIGTYTISQINAGEFQELAENKQPNDYYEEIRLKMNSIREANGLTYLYTMAKQGDEYYYVVDGMPMDSTDASELGEVEENAAAYDQMIRAFETGKGSEGQITSDEYGELFSTYVPIQNEAGEIIGVVGVDIDATSIYKMLQENIKNLAILIGLALVISMAVVYLFSKILMKPLTSLVKEAEKISKGDFTVQIDTNRKDGIGTLSRAFHHMVEALKQIILEINQASVQMNETASDLSNHVKTTDEAANQIAESMTEAAVGSHKQSEEVNTIAHMMNQSVALVQNGEKEIKNTVQNAVKSAAAASEGEKAMAEAARQLTDLIGKANESSLAVKRLTDRSEEVGGIIGLISDIASQTNLLALNAAIEAARAGESGKGFAVVASEVRKLAEQTQSASNQIMELIGHIQHETSQTVGTMESTVEAVQKQEALIEKGASALHIIEEKVRQTEIDTAYIQQMLTELQHCSSDVLQALENISAVIEENTAVSEEVASSSSEQSLAISDIAKTINHVENLSSDLKSKVGKFKLS